MDNGAVTDGRARALKQRTHCMVKGVAKEWISTQLVERGRGDTVNRCGSNAKLGLQGGGRIFLVFCPHH